MRLLVTFLLIVLAGCNSESDQNPGDTGPAEEPSGIPDTEPYMITEGGLFVFWESKTPPETVAPFDQEVIDPWWNETEQCLGLEAEPPIVRIVDNINDYCLFKAGGTSGYCRSMEPNIIFHNLEKAYISSEEFQEDRRSWKHEFIHHIMEMNGRFEHRKHQPDWLWQCQYN